jgi:hypothetical protein
MVVAIVGETKILLIKETTKPLPHYWKLVSETMEPNEVIARAICRAVEEEAGLKLDIPPSSGGTTINLATDARVKGLTQFVPPHMVSGRFPHRRHFWGILTTDKVVMSLSGKHLTGDSNEEIDTMAFNIYELDGMVDFLPQHRELILRAV